MDKRLEILRSIDNLVPYFQQEYSDGGFPYDEKSIYNTSEFIRWKARANYVFQNLKSAPLVDEAITLLNGFKGWDDETRFEKLRAIVDVIVENPDDFLTDNNKVIQNAAKSEKLKRGTIIYTVYNDYELIEQVGQGGNGRVFSAKTLDDELFAIKFVERNESDKKYKRLKNEIHFCENTNHKNIIRIVDRGFAVLDDAPYVFYVMPLYPDTLRKRIAQGISPDDAIQIFVGIINGLGYAHKKGTIHRDIKPENILFGQGSNEPVICDFGIAHFSEDELLTLVETKQGDRLANFQYAAPEQRVKSGAKMVTERADVFSAALILNEMFTKQIPQSSGYKKIADVNPEYAFLDTLFEKLFRQNPVDRLYPIEEVITELNALVSINQNEKEKQRIEQLTYNTLETKEINISITNRQFQNGKLIFELNQNPPQKWSFILKSGEYSHSSTLRVDPRITSVELNWLILTMSDPTEDDIKSAVKMVPEWVSTTNKKYNEMQRKIARKEQQKKEKEREQKLRTIEQENRINSLLADL